jgi:hypothetical protein
LLIKVCNQIVQAQPLILQKQAGERKILPVDKDFRYLRFRAIGNMEVDGFNGNHDSFPYEHFEDSRPGFGYKSFINKSAHYEHNCILPGTLIQMGDGQYKKVEDVVEGDFVVTHEGIQKVLKTFKNVHKGKLVKIDAIGIHSSLSTTALHPIWVVSKERMQKVFNKRRIKRQSIVKNNEEFTYDDGIEEINKNIPEPYFTFAEDLKLGDYVIMPKGDILQNSCEEIEDIRIARLLGYYLAEGSLGGNKDVKGNKLNQVVEFSFHKEEKEFVEEISELIEELSLGSYNIHLSSNTDKDGNHNCMVLTLYSSKFANLCYKHCGKNAKTKVLSCSVLSQSSEWKKEFLKRYFNGDGWISETGDIKSSTASEILNLQLQQIIHSLGVTCSIRKHKQNTPNDSWVKNSYGNPIYVLSFSKSQSSKVFDFVDIPEQRSQQLISTKYGVLTRLTNIEFLEYDGITHNFEVENSNSYVAGGIIVHNSAEGIRGSIGNLPDAFLNKFIYPDDSPKKWANLLGKDNHIVRAKILQSPNQKDGSIEVLMAIDTTLLNKKSSLKPQVKQALERIIRAIDTGQKLACSMGTNVQHSVCSACGTDVRFAKDYCTHLSRRKGGITIVTANEMRDLMDKDIIRPEWLKHICVSKYDAEELVKSASNKAIAVKNGEINHELSFFELSVVAIPAYAKGVQLEKLARQQNEEYREYLRRIAKEFGPDSLVDLYEIMQENGIISNQCMTN